MSLEALVTDLLVEQRKTNSLLSQLVQVPDKQLYKLKDASKLLGLSYSTLLQKTATGEWPSHLNGRRRLVNLDEVKAAMNGGARC